MKYAYLAILAASVWYTFSFARYSYKNGSKLAAVGSWLLAAAAIVLPAMLIFTR